MPRRAGVTTDPPSAAASSIARAARVVVAVAMLVIGASKFLGGPPHGPPDADGLAGVLAVREVSLASACVEVAVGLGLLSPLRRLATPALVAWLAAVSGITLALVLGGVSLEACGCAGPLSIPRAARVATVAGMCALTFVWTTLEREAAMRTPGAGAR
jgi:predicted small lipoprotein YifL